MDVSCQGNPILTCLCETIFTVIFDLCQPSAQFTWARWIFPPTFPHGNTVFRYGKQLPGTGSGAGGTVGNGKKGCVPRDEFAFWARGETVMQLCVTSGQLSHSPPLSVHLAVSQCVCVCTECVCVCVCTECVCVCVCTECVCVCTECVCVCVH